MQAPPAFTLDVTRFGVWHGARLLLGAASVTVALAWATSSAMPAAMLGVPAVVLGLSVLACRRTAAFRLGWDGREWSVDGTPCRDVSVAVDLGGWLLLRARAEGSRRVLWLPLQRRGHAPAWHALRCAVVGARAATTAAVSP